VPASPVSLGGLAGVRVGHAEAPAGTSGVTVALFDTAASVVVDVRGGASGTYDTASLALDATFGRRWALFFAGGSLYGLDAARGIRTRVLESGGGQSPFGNPNPVVPLSGAVLFDLPHDRTVLPDYLPLGYEAALRATARPMAIGRVGAGAGATVGKYLGRGHAMPGGVGAASGRAGTKGHLVVLVAVNSVGAIRDPSSGSWVAGARNRAGGVVPPGRGSVREMGVRGTTLGLVITDLRVPRTTLARVAAMVHAGLATAIQPYHSSTDGDVLFVATTERFRPDRERRPGSDADDLGRRAADLAVRAVLRAAGREVRD
jgi:L-aminopeptidase/D-esterase-like protein